MEQVVKEYISEKNIPHEELHLHIEAIDQRFMASGARNAAETASVELLKKLWNDELPRDGSRDHQRYQLNVVSQLVYEGAVDAPIAAASQGLIGPSTGLQVTIANVIMSNRQNMPNVTAVMLAKAIEVGAWAAGLRVLPVLYNALSSVVTNLGFTLIPATIAAIVSVLLLNRGAQAMSTVEEEEEEEEEAPREISAYDRKHQNRNETREEYIMRAGHIHRVNEHVAGLPVKRAIRNDEGQLLRWEDEGTVREDTPNTVGWDTNSGNLLSRMVTIPKMRGPFDGPVENGKRTYYAQMGNVIEEDDTYGWKEKEESRFRCIRCMALKADGKRYRVIINMVDAMGNPGIFCGSHNKNPNQARVTDKWAVDEGCDMMGGRTTGPASRKELASDENKLRF